ncbi:unnamed protein product [Lactuca saligna]|uniref:Uncharacterized protein n=1 Tax=Lactuca saligna TaxID=75948 RepID=A0AA35YTX2_LACSI|nr:unnamed protein product [Lactuca saligna]
MGMSHKLLAQSTPLFIDSTSTTTTTTNEPTMFVNPSDVEAGASGFTLGHSTPPISPLRQDDPDTIYGEDEEDIGSFTYSPFNIRIKSDDQAPVTRGQFNAFFLKFESLMKSTKTTTCGNYSQEIVKAFFETLTKEHSTNLDKTNQAIDPSAFVCKETIEKVDNLITDA